MTDLERAYALVHSDPEHIEAALAAARREGAEAEREKVAMWMIMRSIPTGHGNTVEDLLAELRAVVAAEMRERAAQEMRERAAQEADKYRGRIGYDTGACIRALFLTPEEGA